MLAFNFDYYKPVSLKEAIELFQKLDRQQKQPQFFSGGTELITLGRLNLAYSEAVIDVKGIQEIRGIESKEDQLFIGAGIPLAEIEKWPYFPLLSKIVSEIADHTAREKITLGGNICAQIFYREAALPFLLGENDVVVAGREGLRQVAFNDLFSEQLRLGRGELLVQLVADKRLTAAPYFAVKRRQQWETGYPLITIASVKIAGQVQVAISGYCSFPFRANQAEVFLNNQELPLGEKVKRALDVLPEPVLDDVEGSADYRRFVLSNLFNDVLLYFEEVEGI